MEKLLLGGQVVYSSLLNWWKQSLLHLMLFLQSCSLTQDCLLTGKERSGQLQADAVCMSVYMHMGFEM
jgi:hypothetical protein